MLQAGQIKHEIFPQWKKRRTAALGPSSVRGNLLGDNGSYKKLRSCLGHLCCFQFFTFLCKNWKYTLIYRWTVGDDCFQFNCFKANIWLQQAVWVSSLYTFSISKCSQFRQSQQIFKQTSNFKLKIYQISFDATVHAILSILNRVF